MFKDMADPLRLYIKPWCPWCQRAMALLDERGYRYERIDVTSDAAGFEEMRKRSGQPLTPTLVTGELVLADFGPEQLDAFLEKHGILPG